MFRRMFAMIAIGVLALSLAAPAVACPLCKEAISTPDGDEPNNLPAAYNNSIYMMIGVPYATLGFVGFFVYRGLKKNAEYFEKIHDEIGPPE
jgi:hypothetical protein